ncbi:YolD-like family protein [Peribacillus sp. NPDC097895]|uniref:YolD-like family protein n=1 Tax=Peribacillus sp. NPDC097895 TaxID=3390619 RepID=UPI003D08902B
MSTIRDRGLVKWEAALIMPEHKALNSKLGEVDYFLNKKPVLDEYQVEEFEYNIHYALEYHLPISFKLHNEGKPHDLHGYCVYIHRHERVTYSEERDHSYNGLISCPLELTRTR